jgi:3-methyladenine DNA glycosylase AlkD
MSGRKIMKAVEARTKLHALASPEVAAVSARFFKTGPGQYGQGDTFIGVRVPDLRKLARECRALPLSETDALLHSPVHEERLLALLILVLGLSKCEADHWKAVYDLYLGNTQFVNNWDLVDSSAPAIVGGYLRDKPRQPLVRLAKSQSLWERRIAIVATQHFIRLDQFEDTLTISRLLLGDKEDLIHKATGWMLREVGERDETALVSFLDEHAATMPRTMLRYAIEKFTTEKRERYLDAGRSTKRKQRGA